MKLLKILFTTVGILLLLIIIAAIAAPFIINPNNYKPQIAEQVKKATGRDLSLGGDINLSFFPWLGAKIEDISLSNPPGFSQSPFAKLDDIQVKVKILPLLKKEIEIGTVILDGLDVNLIKNAQGKTNWEDLSQPKKEEQSTKASTEDEDQSKDKKSSMAIAGITIGGISIQDAHISYRDDQEKKSYDINHFNITSDTLEMGKPANIALNTDFKANDPNMSGHLDFGGTVNADLENKQYSVKNLNLKTNAQGEQFAKPVSASIGASGINVNLNKETLSLQDLLIDAFGLKLKGQASGTQILSGGTINGELASNQFDPKQIANSLGIELPPTADQTALTMMQLGLVFGASSDSFNANKLIVKLDESTLAGNASVKNFKQPAIRYSLALDKINADRYLPPKTEKSKKEIPAVSSSSATKDTKSKNSGEIPVDTLRKLNIDGLFKIGALVMNNLRIQDIQMGVNAKNGLVKVSPVAAKLYEGTFNTNATVDARGQTPKLALDEKLANLQIGPLLKDYSGRDTLQGTTNLNANFTSAGANSDAIKSNLNGTAGFSVADGVFRGVDVSKMIKEVGGLLSGGGGGLASLASGGGIAALASGGGLSSLSSLASGGDSDAITKFGSIKGTLAATNGVVENNDLDLQSPIFQAKGKGTANLVNENISYQLDLLANELKGTTIPVQVSGTLSQPKYGVDMASLMQGQVGKDLKGGLMKEAGNLMGGKGGSPLGGVGDLLGGGSKESGKGASGAIDTIKGEATKDMIQDKLKGFLP
ncbi:AsmA family protein [Candidatus Nitrosacidococcus sp. I8]|uniref:AsmA family protein n=1 Tax=Candidatus Nitrosacidococcus sp. I8 TaxID=2942908 RepID=UPI0022267B87|nr:AsmA family protein [Candidatus Nitrosacidococcus sp. I8]CAH9017749.1 hypothetical protein NURINAE_00531 [Candidatus Nitrosacidococcus sp. I8]